MRAMSTNVCIDLSRVANDAQLLSTIGEALCLGGPAGNHPTRVGVNRGWGLNWHALNDSLSCLDTGGIWGTSPKLSFPLMIRFEQSGNLRRACPEALTSLREILLDTQALYAQRRLEFAFELIK